MLSLVKSGHCGKILAFSGQSDRLCPLSDYSDIAKSEPLVVRLGFEITEQAERQ
jgi:hypothetical protein